MSSKNEILVQEIYEKIKNSKLLAELQNSVEVDVSSFTGDVRKRLKKLLKESGYLIEIQNIVFNYTRKREKYEENLNYLKKAQRSWEKCIIKSINNMCTELGLPLSRARELSEQKELENKFDNMSLGAEYSDEAYKNLRPVYSSADFFEVLTSIKNNNSTHIKSGNHSWGLIRACLQVDDISEIRRIYCHLKCFSSQMGLNSVISHNQESSFESEWRNLGEKVVAKKLCSAAEQYLKQGCPSGLRKNIWMVYLNLNLTDMDRLYYEQLKKSVYEYDLLVDYLIMKDVRLTTTNDDSFFVFEDVLYQALLVFSRDTSLLKHFYHSSASPPCSHVRGHLGEEGSSVYYPPCGIFPFHGFSMLAAPLCYIYERADDLYFVFRELYARMFFKLHTISSDPQGILSICSLFESLLQSEEADLAKHMLDIRAFPVKLVFNWLIFAYSGFLCADETLQLWDRILGYNSFHLLAVLGVAILSFRRENLMLVSTYEAAEAVLADISTIKVVPLLVQFLSRKKL